MANAAQPQQSRKPKQPETAGDPLDSSKLKALNASEGDKKSKWSALLDELNTKGSGSTFFFPKAGKTRVRLVVQPGTEDDFYIETVSHKYGNKGKTKYIVLGVVIATDQGELSEQFKDKVVGLVVPKMVLSGIIGLLVEDYDLLNNEDAATGITIIRSGSGLDTSYSVMPSKGMIDLPENIIWPEHTLEEMATMYEEQSMKGSDSGSEEDDKPAKNDRRNRRRATEESLDF